jgi:hypothetical protein
LAAFPKTQEMLDYSVANNIYPQVEVIPVRQLDEAFQKATFFLATRTSLSVDRTLARGLRHSLHFPQATRQKRVTRIVKIA